MDSFKEPGHSEWWKRYGRWWHSGDGRKRERNERCGAKSVRRGGGMNVESAVMLVISFGLMVYLIYALLRPEKF